MTWVSLGFILVLVLGRFGSILFTLGRFETFWILFWVALCHSPLFWLYLVCFDSFWVILGNIRSFCLFWLVLAHFSSPFGSFYLFSAGFFVVFFSIGIHSMQGWTATTRHRVTRKRNTKRLRHTGNLFRKNLQLKDVC